MAQHTKNFVLNNRACWYGTLDGFAAVVMPACERAVQLVPADNPLMAAQVRDSRGVARALTGNLRGAAEDFTFFLAHWKEGDDLRVRRLAWLDSLKAGRNPFDKATLKALRLE